MIKTSSALLLQLVQTSCHDVLLEGKAAEKRRLQERALKRQESMLSVSDSQKPEEPQEFLDEYGREAVRLYEKGLESATKAAGTIVLFLTSRLVSTSVQFHP